LSKNVAHARLKRLATTDEDFSDDDADELTQEMPLGGNRYYEVVNSNDEYLLRYLKRTTKSPISLEFPAFGLAIQSTIVYFNVTERDHPLLFEMLARFQDIDCSKLVPVSYDANFRRPKRLTKTVGWDSQSLRRHPAKGTEWHHYCRDVINGYCYFCLRRFPGQRAKRDHLGAGSKPISCEVLKLLLDRDHCFFYATVRS